MHHRMITAVGLVTLAVAIGACSREATVEPESIEHGELYAMDVESDEYLELLLGSITEIYQVEPGGLPEVTG